MTADHSHSHTGHSHVDETKDSAYTNLVGLHEQSTLNIKSYKLQYTIMFIFLLVVIFLTVRAFSNPFPYFIEYVVLITAIFASIYHVVTRFI